MNFKIYRGISIFFLALFVIFLTQTTESNKMGATDDSKSPVKNEAVLAALLNGSALSEFPTPENNYGIENVNCSKEAIGTFKTTNWSFVVENITKTGTTCIANFSTTIPPESSTTITAKTKEEVQSNLENLDETKNSIISTLTEAGLSGISEDSTLEEIATTLNSSNIIVIGSSQEILTNNSSLTGGWSGSNTMSYNYSSLPSMTYTTVNTMSFANVSSVQASASFGYYVDEGKTESAKLTVNIIDSSGNVVATNYSTASKGGFSSGSTNMTTIVSTASLTGNYKVQIVMAITGADGSHVTTTSSLSSCYLVG